MYRNSILGRWLFELYRLAKDKALGMCDLSRLPRISSQRGLRLCRVRIPLHGVAIGLPRLFLKGPPAVSARRRRFEERTSISIDLLMCALQLFMPGRRPFSSDRDMTPGEGVPPRLEATKLSETSSE